MGDAVSFWKGSSFYSSFISSSYRTCYSSLAIVLFVILYIVWLLDKFNFFFFVIPEAFWLIIGSLTNNAMGSYCVWPSSSCPCSRCITRFVPCCLNTFWPFHVAGWNDIWLWLRVCYNHGRNNYWDGAAISNWSVFPWSHTCKIFMFLEPIMTYWREPFLFFFLLTFLFL